MNWPAGTVTRPKMSLRCAEVGGFRRERRRSSLANQPDSSILVNTASSLGQGSWRKRARARARFGVSLGRRSLLLFPLPLFVIFRSLPLNKHFIHFILRLHR